MKKSKLISTAVLAGFLMAMTLAGCSKQVQTAEGKPYPLDTCLVCGMKIDAKEKPYVFVYQGQQIKVCDASEKATFEKDPAKYMKQLQDAQAGLKK